MLLIKKLRLWWELQGCKHTNTIEKERLEICLECGSTRRWSPDWMTYSPPSGPLWYSPLIWRKRK